MADKLALTDDQRTQIRGVHTTFSEKFKAQREYPQGSSARQEEAKAPGNDPHPSK